MAPGQLPQKRTKYLYGFSKTMEKVLEYEAQGLKRNEITPLVGGLKKAQMSKGLRILLTARGKTPDSGHLEVKNFACDLVKQLDADEISLHNADEALLNCIRQVTGTTKTTYRRANTIRNPDLQLEGYRRAVAALEGICYGLDKMPDVVHSSISNEDRTEIETRLASCRRIIERRINIFRKDNNVGERQ